MVYYILGLGTVMNEYTLYLDESYTYRNNGKKPAFAVGGFIVKNSDIPNVNFRIDELKKEIWKDLNVPTDVILHELDLKDALNKRIKKKDLKSEYVRFRDDNRKANTLYRRISKIIKTQNIHTVGCVVIKNRYFSNFPKVIANEISLVCMQIIIENYVHFLMKNDATGSIVYESRDAMDNTMLRRYYQIASIGTMYIKPDAIQQRILQFRFIHKKENCQCLQLADFIPNIIARKMSKKTIYPNTKDLINNILLKSYDGTNNNKDRYGIKTVPRISNSNTKSSK